MLEPLAFFTSIAFSCIAWGLVFAQYIWPELRSRARADALRPLLALHSFRFLGLAFLVPGVVSSDLPWAFAASAAFGDIVAAMLALLTLRFLRTGTGVLFAWIFNVWGSVDLLNAFYQANATGLAPGQLGAAYFIPTLIVPLLLITHVLMFRVLLQPQSQPAMHDTRLSHAR
jgi:hypothetical protein